MMANAKVIELARLQLAVDSAPGDELLVKRFEDELNRLDGAGFSGAARLQAAISIALWGVYRQPRNGAAVSLNRC